MFRVTECDFYSPASSTVDLHLDVRSINLMDDQGVKIISNDLAKIASEMHLILYYFMICELLGLKA